MTTPLAYHLSREDAEALHGRPGSVVVSITDPEKPQARLRHGWGDVLRLSFCDIVEPQRGHQLMTVGQARGLVSFLRHWRGRDVIAHCEAGVSRSGAVAEYLRRAYGYEVVGEEWFNPNAYVLKLLEDVGGVWKA